jgi:hypothetical protein
MNKPVGGRGKKAPYQTTIKRIPIDLESQIDSLIESYRLKAIEGTESDPIGMMSVTDAKQLAKKLLKAKMSKLDTVVKLVTGIYNEPIDKQELTD